MIVEQMYSALYNALASDRRALGWRMTPFTIAELRSTITMDQCIFSAPDNRFEFSGLPIEVTNDVSDWELMTEKSVCDI